MRVLIATDGSHGDVLPFVAIGKELKHRGHEVILYSNAFFENLVTEAGIDFVPVTTAEEYTQAFGELTESNPSKAFKTVAKHLFERCPRYYDAMKMHVLTDETIIVGHSISLAPRLLAETEGLPCVAVHLAPSVFRSSEKPARLAPRWIHENSLNIQKKLAWWAIDRFFYDPHFTKPLNKLREKMGLPQVSNMFRSWIHEADGVLGLFPDWFAMPASDWPRNVSLVGFPFYDHGAHAPMNVELQAFLDAGSAPVVFSAGTANADAAEFFQTSIDACAKLGARAVLVSHHKDQIPARLPDGMIHVDYAPFGTLLPKAAAFVHHGGIGAISQALRAGVPQLIRPVAFDQFDNAARAMCLGVAEELLAKQYRVKAVADALQRLVDNSALKERCLQLAQHCQKGDAINAACDSILSQLSDDSVMARNVNA